jgi:short chain dehydrogenase
MRQALIVPGTGVRSYVQEAVEALPSVAVSGELLTAPGQPTVRRISASTATCWRAASSTRFRPADQRRGQPPRRCRHRAGTAGTQAHTVRADLRTPEGVERVHSAVVATGRPLAAAALNAGVGRGGAFLDIDIDDEVEIIDLNITSTVRLARTRSSQAGWRRRPRVQQPRCCPTASRPVSTARWPNRDRPTSEAVTDRRPKHSTDLRRARGTNPPRPGSKGGCAPSWVSRTS